MRITREELYKRVWESPLTRLAREFDISDVGLAKACRAHGIPTPPVGHWTKVAHGKTMNRPRLPPGENTTVVLEAAKHRSAPSGGIQPPVALPAISVRELGGDFKNTLSAVSAATYAALTKAKPDRYGFVRSGSSSAFECVLSAASAERACVLLDAIERALPSCEISLGKDPEKRQVELRVEGERLTFELSEGYRRSETVAVNPRHEWDVTRTFSYAFTGELKLTLRGDFPGRKTWADGNRATLEQKLGHFVVGIVHAGRAIRDLREAREAQRRHWEEQARLAAIEREEARRIEQFRTLFSEEAAGWRAFRGARAYLKHLESALEVAEADGSLTPYAAEWLATARSVVARMDPSLHRLERLLKGESPPEYLAPFGSPVFGGKPLSL